MSFRMASLLTAVAVMALGTAFSAEAKEAKKIGLAVANLQANFFNQIKNLSKQKARRRKSRSLPSTPRATRRHRSTRSRICSRRTSMR